MSDPLTDLKAQCSQLLAERRSVQQQVLQLTAERDAAQARLSARLAAMENVPSKPMGQRPIYSSSSGPGFDYGSARAAWDAAVEAEMAKGLTRPQAVQRIAYNQPELREAMVAEANAERN